MDERKSPFELYTRGYWLQGTSTPQVAGGGGAFVPATITFEVPTSNTIIRIMKVGIRSTLNRVPAQYQANSIFCRVVAPQNVISPFGSGSPPYGDLYFGQVHGPLSDLRIDVGLDLNKQFTMEVVSYTDSWSIAAIAGDVRVDSLMVYVEENITRYID